MSPIPAVLMLEGVLDRLEATVELESQALTERRTVDFEEINRRKSRSLLELSRAVRALPDRVDGPLGTRLARLRAALLRNHDLLKIHLGAAQEVAAILDDALREAESDGTYSASLGTRRGGR